MEEQKGVCEICLDTISHPICLNCYLKHLKVFLKDIKLNESTKNQIIKKAEKELFKDTLNDDKCIICGEEVTSICTYCLCFRLQKIIKKFNLNKEDEKSFTAMFNYLIEDDEKEKLNCLKGDKHCEEVEIIFEETTTYSM